MKPARQIPPWPLLLALLLALTGCSGGGRGGTGYIEDLQFQCTGAQAAACAGGGYTVFVGLARTLSADCDDYLYGLSAAQRQSAFAASGTTTSAHSGIYMTGIVTAWVDANGAAISALDDGTYQVCAFADIDGNDRIDMNEPVGRGELTVGAKGFVLSDWSAAFN